MVEKKTLTEEQLNKSLDNQLKKTSKDMKEGDICPVCNAGILKINRYGSIECTLCPYVFDPNF